MFAMIALAACLSSSIEAPPPPVPPLRPFVQYQLKAREVFGPLIGAFLDEVLGDALTRRLLPRGVLHRKTDGFDGRSPLASRIGVNRAETLAPVLLGHAARSVPNVLTSNALRAHPRRPARPRKLPKAIPRSHRPRPPRRAPNLPARRPPPSRPTLHLRSPRLGTRVARRRRHRVHGCARLKTASGGRRHSLAVNKIPAARQAHTRQTKEQSAVRTAHVFNWKSACPHFVKFSYRLAFAVPCDEVALPSPPMSLQ